MGGGVAGLATAIGLARRGIRPSVHEAREQGRANGVGIQITPNGAAVLRALGLENQLHQVSTPVSAVEIRDFRSGRILYRFDVARYRQNRNLGHLLLHRQDLISILENAARDLSISLRFDSRQSSFFLTEKGFGMETGDGSPTVPRVIVGADGIGSTLRKLVDQEFPNLPVQHVALRKLLPVDQKLDTFSPDTVQLFVAPRRHLVKYKVRSGQLLNVVAVETLAAPVGTSKLKIDAAARLARFLADFADQHHLVEREAEIQTFPIRCGYVSRNWYKKNVVLVGDALHPVPPFLAQGGSMALEDSWSLVDSLLCTSEIGSAFELFRQNRAGRVERLVRYTNRQVSLTHSTNPLLRKAMSTALDLSHRWYPKAVAQRYHWIYDWKPGNTGMPARHG